MAKKRGSPKYHSPDPINGFVDLAGAVAMGIIARQKLKSDIKNGQGEESAMAARMVFGAGAMKSGSAGLINLGGLIGINSVKMDSEQEHRTTFLRQDPPFVSPIETVHATPDTVNFGLWREYCEDASAYGIYPENFSNPDDYDDAIKDAKAKTIKQEKPLRKSSIESTGNVSQPGGNKYRWRKYCEDGSKYGVLPEDYETADDYADALMKAMETDDEQNKE